MKKNYLIFLFACTIAVNSNIKAQCSSCTLTISSTDIANHIIAPGQTMCITATGSATGLITIAGGTLCNQGTINSSNLWVQGGTFNNYGSITTTNVLTSNAGTFNNYGTAIIDSLLITHASSSYINSGTVTNLRFAVTSNATATNTGTITADYMLDSIGTFTNNGNLTINVDYANAYSSNFTNNNYMKVTRDFYNSYSSTFLTNCMIVIGRDWYNQAVLNGPSIGSCGGFNIAGLSYNTGTIGTPTTHVDLCDAGHPALGIDGPSGTIANTTTYCNCTNSCVLMTGIVEPGIQSNVLIQAIYPNPAANNLSIVLTTNKPEQIQVEVIDMIGRKQITKNLKISLGENKTMLDVSSFASGTYILSITDSQQLQLKQMFNVVK